VKSRFSDSPIPLYLQLADLFRERIARGVWPNEHRLPSLEELVEEFGVARVTVRQSIELLAREGLVSPQRGRGTFVTGMPKRDHFISVVTRLDDLIRTVESAPPKIVTIEETTATPSIGPNEGKPAPKYVFMRRVYQREKQPYCVINIYLDERIFIKASEEFRSKTVIPVLVGIKGVAVAKASQVLTVRAAGMEVARLLELPMNAPIAEVRRIFRDKKDTVIYLAEIAYRGDVIRVEMDLKP